MTDLNRLYDQIEFERLDLGRMALSGLIGLGGSPDCIFWEGFWSAGFALLLMAAYYLWFGYRKIICCSFRV